VSEQAPGAGFADDAHRYRLDERIATGGMGAVWRGTDTTLGREVAIKLLKDEYADDASFRARFETEARHAASLHHHNIAAVYDFGEAATADGSGGRRPFLVMELVDGQPLSALLRPDAPMDPAAVRGLLAQAADGLAAAHAAGIVHRDVKPANLLVTPDRQVKVTDFGIARAAEGVGLTQTGEVMGTPQYLSPEQARGETATPASDVYSLGVVAFECLAGRRPFVADTAVATALAHLREPVPQLPESVPDDLAVVVRRAMAKLPQDRFADGAAFAAALRDPATAATQVAPPPQQDETQVLTGVAPAPPVPVPGPSTGHLPGESDRGTRRNALWPVLAVLAVVVVGLLVWLLVARGSGDEAPDEQPSNSPRPTPSQSSREPTEPSSTPRSSAPASTSPSASPTRTSSPTQSASPTRSSEPATPSTSASPSASAPTTASSAAEPPTSPSASSAGTAASQPATSPSPSTSPIPSSRGRVDRR
jgi:serine/threonine protein kinase